MAKASPAILEKNNTASKWLYVALIMLFLYGCGSGSDNSSSGTQPGVLYIEDYQSVILSSEDENSIENVSICRRFGTLGNVSLVVSLKEISASLEFDVDLSNSVFTSSNNWSYTATLLDDESCLEVVLGEVIDDSEVEGNEFFVLKISSATGGASIENEDSRGIQIGDNDIPPGGVINFKRFDSSAFFNLDNIAINEDKSGLSVYLERTGDFSGPVSVDFSVDPGSTTSIPEDFFITKYVTARDPFNTAGTPEDISSTNLKVDWDDSDPYDREVVLEFVDDLLAEGTETIRLNLTNVTGGAAIGTYSSLIIELIDNDSPGWVDFISGSLSGTEGNDVSVDVVRSNGSNGAVTIQVIDQGTGSAAPRVSSGPNISDDYQRPDGYDDSTGNTLTWADGETGPKQLTFELLSDTFLEATETIDLALSSPSGGLLIGLENTATISILDNNADNIGNLRFVATDYTVNENAGTAIITVQRFNGSSGIVSTDYSAIGTGTAFETVDFNTASGTLTWADGDSTNKTFTVQILDDGDLESNETVDLFIGDPTPPTLVYGTPTTATLIIVDDEVAPPAWQLISSGTSETLLGADFFDSGSGVSAYYATGVNGTIIKDFVEQESGLSTVSLNNLSVCGACFGGVATAVGDGGNIVFTTDGGITAWNSASTTDTVNNLNDTSVSEVSGVNIAIGDSGTIIQADDNSLDTWSSVSSIGSAENLNSVSFADSSNGWAVGDNATILKTSDGGDNWPSQAVPAVFSENLNAVKMFRTVEGHNNTGWAVGDNGSILVTTDGSTWTEQTSGTDQNLHGIAVFAELEDPWVWVVGDNGTILFTDDGGTNWVIQNSGTTTNFNDIANGSNASTSGRFSNLLWAVGEGGVVYKTTTGGH